MLKLQFEPLAAWPKPPTKNRDRATFTVKYEPMLAHLSRELELIGAKDIVIAACLTRDQIRLDGHIRASAKPSMPGVIVYFASKHGPLSFVCDTYTEWTDNLRAIGLTLQNLRAVERYGATQQGEQYKGYLALPAPPPNLLSESHAALLLRFSGGEFVGNPVGRIEKDAAFRKMIYNSAAMKTHPDTGGNDADFIAVQNAYDALES